MPRSLPPLTWFRSFEASARLLSFTAAADELGLTQSAISQQVRSLELRLGVALFHRKPRGLALTDHGRKLLPRVGASLDQLGQAVAGFDTGSRDGLLTVATSISIARWVISPNLARFRARHPDLRIRILGTIWPDEFKSALADVEIRFGSQAQVGSGATRLGPDGLIAVAAGGVALQGQALIETVGASEGWGDWFKHAGLPPQEPSVFVDTYGAALDLAVGGAGVALASSLLARQALAERQLVRVHASALPSSDGYFLAVNSDAPGAVGFADWLSALVADAR